MDGEPELLAPRIAPRNFQHDNGKVNWLVVEPPHRKNMSQIGHLPQIGVNSEHEKYLKPPPSNHVVEVNHVVEDVSQP